MKRNFLSLDEEERKEALEAITFEELSISFVFDEDNNNTSNTIENVEWKK